MIFLSSEFRTNSFKNTIRVSRSLEPDLARRLCSYNPSPNCKGHQQMMLAEKNKLQQNLCKTATLKKTNYIVSLNAGQKYCRMLQWHSAILLTFIKQPFVIKIFILSILSGLLHRFYCMRILTANVMSVGCQENKPERK